MDNLQTTSRNWRNDAACAGLDGDWWFPQEGDTTDVAKRICRGCPVRQQCLVYAVTEWPSHGIYGGYTMRQLRRMSTAARKRPCRHCGAPYIPRNPLHRAYCSQECRTAGRREQQMASQHRISRIRRAAA